MQVFYVNIGGGEPTVRPDFWELVDYATAHHVGREVLHQRRAHHAGGRRAAGRQRLRRRADLARRRDGRGQRRRARARLVRDGDPGAGEPGRGRASRDAKISVVVTRHNVDQLDEFEALADRYGATLRITRLRPSGRGADVWDELHPTAEQQVQLYDWLVGHGDGVLTGDSFFHLSGARRAGCAGRPEPVRRRPGGVPHRPGRRRLRLPVRHPRPVPRRKHRCPTAASTTCGRTPRCSSSCASRSRPARAAAADTTTAAAAAAWRPSSSPACRWTAPTPNACRATACPRWLGSATSPGPSGDHSRGSRLSSAGPVPLTLTTRPPARPCNESPV